MHRIEDDLKAALRRKPAPPGFAASVLERIEDDEFVRKNSRRLTRGRLWMLAAAAMAVMMISAIVFEHQRYVRNRNEAALQHTLTAISIAAIQLDRAESRAFEPLRWERLGRQVAGLENDDQK